MKKLNRGFIPVAAALLLIPLIAGIAVGRQVEDQKLGAPSTELVYQKTVLPVSDSAYDLGTTTQAWRNVYFDQVCLTADTCRTSWPSGGGGSGNSAWTINGSAGLIYNATSTDKVGVGTTTPFAKFGIHANNGETKLRLFDVASSTSNATTSLFNISNTGDLFSLGKNDTFLDSNAGGGNRTYLDIQGSGGYGEFTASDELYLSAASANINISNDNILNSSNGFTVTASGQINLDGGSFLADTTANTYSFTGASTGIEGILSFSSVSGSDKTFTFPNFTGTVCLSDVNCAATTTANTWSSLQTFTSGILANASSTLQNFTFVNATGSQATTSALAVSRLTAADCDVKANTSGSLYCGTDTTGGGQNSKWATTTDGGWIYPNASTNTGAGIGTTTPKWALQVASSTRPQLALSDASLTSNHWTLRSISGNLYFATASPSTYATNSTAAIEIIGSTTTFNGGVNITEALDLGGDYIEDITGDNLAVSGGILSVSDGSGSNLDADFLDGLSSASFLRADASSNLLTGNTLTLNAGSTFDINSTNVSIADTSIVFDGATTNFQTTGDFSINTNDIFIESTDGDVIFNGVSTTSASAFIDVSANMLGIGSPNSGDPQVTFAIGNPAVEKWSLGADDSDSDAFVLSAGGTLGTNNHFRWSTASTTAYSPFEYVPDTELYIPASDFEIENNNRICTQITALAGRGILTLTPTAVPSSCTVQFSALIPQILHGENAKIRSATFYYAAASSTALIDTNTFVEYNPTDGTATVHDNDTTDITAGTSHAMSGFPVTLGTSETGSSVLVQLTVAFNTASGASNAMVLRGVKIVWDTD